MTVSGIPVSPNDACLRKLKLLVEERDGRGTTLTIGDRASYLAEFLTVCGRSLSEEPQQGRDQYSEEFNKARDVFTRAGLEALAPRAWQTGNDWVQIGISLREVAGLRSELCRRVAILARQFLNDSLIDNFFFMNKPPGMRLRFQAAAGGSSAELNDVLHGELTCWRNDGLIDYLEPGVYEPEGQLFGGARSMSFVHALFTLDSLIWLDYHACPAVEGAAISPAWLVSMAVLRTVFAGLDIIGWEDIGVWEHIRKMAGRRLGADKTSFPLYAEVSDQILYLWSHRDGIIEELHRRSRRSWPVMRVHSSQAPHGGVPGISASAEPLWDHASQPPST
jgi:thiopeptide-type bacteriocin biosynthesis protein